MGLDQVLLFPPQNCIGQELLQELDSKVRMGSVLEGLQEVVIDPTAWINPLESVSAA